MFYLLITQIPSLLDYTADIADFGNCEKNLTSFKTFTEIVKKCTILYRIALDVVVYMQGNKSETLEKRCPYVCRF